MKSIDKKQVLLIPLLRINLCVITVSMKKRNITILSLLERNPFPLFFFFSKL